MANPRNIGEIPLNHKISVPVTGKDGTVTVKQVSSPMDSQLYQVLSDIREQTLQTRQRLANPDAPTNLKATAQSFSVLLQWTRSSDADYYEVLKSFTPSTQDPKLQIVDVGNSASWVDNLGTSGLKAFYWIRARKTTGASSLTVGPVNATSAVASAGQAQPAPPPPANIQVVDTTTGRVIPYVLADPRSIRQ